jgi:hypothetical protein
MIVLPIQPRTSAGVKQIVSVDATYTNTKAPTNLYPHHVKINEVYHTNFALYNILKIPIALQILI